MDESFERNTVTVRIYGQDYTLSGDMSREYIKKMADYVDEKMTEIGGESNLQISKIAILAAMDIAGELFTAQKDSADCERYLMMCEEAKNGFARAKEDLSMANEQKEELIRQNGEKDSQLGKLYQDLADEKKHNEVLRARVEELTAQIENNVSAPEEAKKHIEELELKCRDIESNFFDIQMENIRLKNENDTFRRRLQG